MNSGKSEADMSAQASHFANPVMAKVGNDICKQYELLTKQGVNTILEWNAGNHFVDSEKRMAKGFAWLLNNEK